ncbi:MAG: hypothetical protein M0R17_08220 [Candidatus Omnitrophica bacterium]|jgi:hypothetical protein|nr:hypothetical protein [Candidatus Omnitrophota bacterium]
MSDNINNEVPYETKFEDGTEITDYLAVGVAEGFESSDGKTDSIKAWSYICGKGLWKGLQGWFGRQVNEFITLGIFDQNGQMDWDVYDDFINQ